MIFKIIIHIVCFLVGNWQLPGRSSWPTRKKQERSRVQFWWFSKLATTPTLSQDTCSIQWLKINFQSLQPVWHQSTHLLAWLTSVRNVKLSKSKRITVRSYLTGITIKKRYWLVQIQWGAHVSYHSLVKKVIDWWAIGDCPTCGIM